MNPTASPRRDPYADCALQLVTASLDPDTTIRTAALILRDVLAYRSELLRSGTNRTGRSVWHGWDISCRINDGIASVLVALWNGGDDPAGDWNIDSTETVLRCATFLLDVDERIEADVFDAALCWAEGAVRS